VTTFKYFAQYTYTSKTVITGTKHSHFLRKRELPLMILVNTVMKYMRQPNSPFFSKHHLTPTRPSILLFKSSGIMILGSPEQKKKNVRILMSLLYTSKLKYFIQ